MDKHEEFQVDFFALLEKYDEHLSPKDLKAFFITTLAFSAFGGEDFPTKQELEEEKKFIFDCLEMAFKQVLGVTK